MTTNCNRGLHRQQRAVAQAVAQQAQHLESNSLFNLLTSRELLDVVEEHLPEHRERRYPPTQTLAMFLTQCLSGDGSCQQAVNELNISRQLGGMSAVSSHTGGYCQARQRLPQSLVQTVVEHSGALLEQMAPSTWRWRGRSVKLVDGSTVSMPDTAANQACFPQHGKQQPGTGFPLARLVAVISLATGAVLSVAMGPFKGKGSGESGLYRRLRECFVPGDVMLADAYYCGFFLIADLVLRGVDAVIAQHSGRCGEACRTLEKLDARDDLVRWAKPRNKPDWMSREEYLAYPDDITVRKVQAGKKVLVTTLLDARETPKWALAELYSSRWNIELDFRSIKDTLGMDILRCQSPQMCEKEVWVYLLAYNLIRLLMAQAAIHAGLGPRQLSFKHTVQIWVAWSRHQFLSNAPANPDILFRLIAQRRVAKRPGRCEPRAVKRRPKANHPRLDRPRCQARQELSQHGQLAA